jgi:hypothetical protein
VDQEKERNQNNFFFFGVGAVPQVVENPTPWGSNPSTVQKKKKKKKKKKPG